MSIRPDRDPTRSSRPLSIPRSRSGPALPVPTAEVEVPADEDLAWVAMALADRRELAVRRARRWARSPCDDRASPAGIGLCRYGRGSVALALAGPMGPPGLAQLRGLVPAIERAGRTELVIDLTGLIDSPPGLVRLLGRLRIRRLIDQAYVEVRGAPPGVEHELLAGGSVAASGSPPTGA